MSGEDIIYDEMLDELRTADVSGGTGGGGSSDLVGGFGISIAGQTVSQDRFFPIETVAGSTVTMQAGHAYTINATSGGITLLCEEFPSSRFGLDGHLQIFTANAGYVQAGPNVFLKEALEPDSINNCLVRFHGGSATISVEDHLGGYIVISGGSADGPGSLPYGLASAASSYIAFSDIPELTGVPIAMGGVATNGEKHIAGNGYADTILTGGVSCTSNTTFANLTMSGVAITGGTATLGDVSIPNGATVSAAGGAGFTIERVTGAGVVDFGGMYTKFPPGAVVSGVTFQNAVPQSGGGAGCFAFSNNYAASAGAVTFTGVTFSGNGTTYGMIWARGGITGSASGVYTVNLSGCTISGNSGTGPALIVNSNAVANISGCTFAGNKLTVGSGGVITLAGQDTIDTLVDGAGSVAISSGASIALTSSIAPGGGIQVVGGTCTVNGNVIESGTYASIDSNGSATV